MDLATFRYAVVHEHVQQHCHKCLHLAYNPTECTHPSRVDGALNFGRIMQCKKMHEYYNPNEMV